MCYESGKQKGGGRDGGCIVSRHPLHTPRLAQKIGKEVSEGPGEHHVHFPPVESARGYHCAYPGHPRRAVTPNQAWLSPQFESQTRALLCISHNEPVVKVLVERAPYSHLNSRSGIITGAVRTCDTAFLGFLVSHGADPTLGTPLSTLAERYLSEFKKASDAKWGDADIAPPVPFTLRRPTEEWL